MDESGTWGCQCQCQQEMEKQQQCATCGSTKKQRSSGMLAIPTQTNSIRNICMQHWNQLQPGGQGTAAHFNAYYKALSDTEKEPFKKQMYIGRGATSLWHSWWIWAPRSIDNNHFGIVK
ncbi:hypothetical protein EDB86DRAFT_2828874 [Lactarius hatsudake]|nr:hypothetical protein EDB86DRAFT_2828874 [Lactarius hatsudake]